MRYLACDLARGCQHVTSIKVENFDILFFDFDTFLFWASSINSKKILIVMIFTFMHSGSTVLNRFCHPLDQVVSHSLFVDIFRADLSMNFAGGT